MSHVKTKRLRSALCVALSILFTLSLVALPVRGAAAARDYSTVRVNLKTNNATVLRIKAKGSYTVKENGVNIKDEEFTVKSTSGGIQVTVGSDTVYSGSECNIVPVNAHRDAGYLTMNSLNYLGEFRVRLRDNSYIQIINSVPMAYYLYGVLAGEMSDAYPKEALRAQALAAKGFVLSKMTGEPNYDIGDTSAEQVYKGYSTSWKNIMEAVDTTITKVLTVNGSYLKTYYAASNGGETQLPQYQWNGMSSSITSAYALSIDEPDFNNASSKLEKVKITYGSASGISSELYAMLSTEAAKVLSGSVTDVVTIHSAELYNAKYTGVTHNMTRAKIDATYKINDSKEERATIDVPVEKLLDYGVFQDTVLQVYWGEKTGDGYTMYHARFGHGVGLSQRGAQQRAKDGDSYVNILKFYYPGADISSIDLSVPSGGSSSTSAPETQKPTNTPAQTTAAPTEKPSGSPTLPPPAYTSNPDANETERPTDKPAATTGPNNNDPRPSVIAQGKVNASGVNLRIGPGLNYEVIVQLDKNTKLDIYDTKNSEWYYVGTEKYIGYMSSRYVDISGGSDTKPTSSDKYRIGYVNATDVNFRTGPDTSYTSMGRIAKNTPLYVWGTEGEWSFIQIGVKYGYMYSVYVTTTGGEHRASDLDGSVWASGEVSATAVNLRQGPSTNYAVVTTLSRGTKLLIYGETENGWLDVAANGQRGYVSGAYVNIEMVNPQPPKRGDGKYDAPMGTGYTTAVDVNFRRMPSTDSKIITKMPKSAKLTLYSLKDGWYEAEYGDERGYVYALYVRTDGIDKTNENHDNSSGSTQTGSGESLKLTVAKSMGKLNFRKAASMDAHVMEVFSGGEKFEVIGVSGDWYYVLHNGVAGYVYKAYTQIVSSGSAPILTVDENLSVKDGVTKSVVNLRMGPSLTTAIITEMPKGQDLTVLAKMGDWYLVRCGALCGFAFAEYVKA